MVVELSNNSAAEEEQMSMDFMITYGSMSYICELGTRRKDAGHVVQHAQAKADMVRDQLALREDELVRLNEALYQVPYSTAFWTHPQTLEADV